MTTSPKESKVKKIIELHRFFVKESYWYMKGTPRIPYYLKYPIAYIKFMWNSLQDIKNQTNEPRDKD